MIISKKDKKKIKTKQRKNIKKDSNLPCDKPKKKIWKLECRKYMYLKENMRETKKSDSNKKKYGINIDSIPGSKAVIERQEYYDYSKI